MATGNIFVSPLNVSAFLHIDGERDSAQCLLSDALSMTESKVN